MSHHRKGTYVTTASIYRCSLRPKINKLSKTHTTYCNPETRERQAEREKERERGYVRGAEAGMEREGERGGREVGRQGGWKGGWVAQGERRRGGRKREGKGRAREIERWGER